MSVRIMDQTRARAVGQGNRVVAAIETMCRKHQSASRNSGWTRDRRRMAPRHAIRKECDVRRRALGGKGHDIHGDMVKIVQSILCRTAVDLTRLQRESEPRSIKGDASFGVRDGYGRMVDASRGPRIGSRELDQLERMA